MTDCDPRNWGRLTSDGGVLEAAKMMMLVAIVHASYKKYTVHSIGWHEAAAIF